MLTNRIAGRRKDMLRGNLLVTKRGLVMGDFSWLLLFGLLSTVPLISLAIGLLWLHWFTGWGIRG
jgi:hypothetical protein